MTPEEAKQLRRRWDDMPAKLSDADKQKIYDTVSKLDETYQQTFGAEGGLFGDAVKTILKSSGELLRVLKILKGMGL